MDEKIKAINKKIWDGMMQAAYDKLRLFDTASVNAENTQKEFLKNLLNDNENTEYGKMYGFSDIHNADEYRKKVPLTVYDDYEEYIKRMVSGGENGLITAYPVVYYASTSGTSGEPKKIPVTDRGLNTFQGFTGNVMRSVIDEFYKNTKNTVMPYGFMMVPMSAAKKPLENGVNFGAISAACVREESIQKLPYVLTTPAAVLKCTDRANHKYLHTRFGIANREVTIFSAPYIPALLDMMTYIKDEWEMLVSDIRNGTIDSAAAMPEELRAELEAQIKPDPERADELEREFKKGFDQTIMKRIWPHLSAICAIWAGNFSSYVNKLREYSGRTVPYYTMSYASSEGVFGFARHPFDTSYCMVPQSCFYEFIPVDGKNAEDVQDTLLMEELQEGKEYELVITNQSGLYRYRMGDVVRVTGFYNETPMIEFRYRKKNIVSVAGEKFTEAHLLSAVREFERRSGVSIIDFCMYPDTSVAPGRYVVLLEPDGVIAESKKEEYTKIIAEELVRASSSYAHYVEIGNMGKPVLKFLQPQTFRLYRELKMYKAGISENQLKPVRVLDTPELVRFFTALEEK